MKRAFFLRLNKIPSSLLFHHHSDHHSTRSLNRGYSYYCYDCYYDYNSQCYDYCTTTLTNAIGIAADTNSSPSSSSSTSTRRNHELNNKTLKSSYKTSRNKSDIQNRTEYTPPTARSSTTTSNSHSSNHHRHSNINHTSNNKQHPNSSSRSKTMNISSEENIGDYLYKNIKFNFSIEPSTSFISDTIRNEILIHARKGDVRKVLELLSSIKASETFSAKQKEEIDAEKDLIIHTLMLAYAKKGDLSKTEFLFRKLKNPDKKCFTILLGAYADKGMVEKAEQLFSKIAKPDEACYVELMRVYSKKGLYNKIQEHYSTIYQKLLTMESTQQERNEHGMACDKIQSEDSFSSSTSSSLLMDLCEMVKTEYISENRVQSDEYEYLQKVFMVIVAFRMHGILKNKDYGLLDATFKRVSKYIIPSLNDFSIPNCSTTTTTSIGNGTIINTNISNTTSTNNTFNTTTNSINSNFNTTSSINSMSTNLISTTPKSHLNILNIYLQSLIQRKAPLDRIESFVKNYISQPDTVTYHLLLVYYFQSNMHDKVDKLFKQISRLEDMNTKMRNYFASTIMTMFYRHGMYHKVEKIFSQIQSPDYSCYKILMNTYVQQQDTYKMMQLFKEIPNDMIDDQLVEDMMAMRRVIAKSHNKNNIHPTIIDIHP
ncbi:hypothetical protein FDP41_007089 [Naegleria fowleri]|uniref:Pentacotripeptide-repeat region of PRORP domain-containing protein n=1 Tax=Naegleria fowleri TaxID=5763 RepID=A0A6A5BFZ4_NAEFO|nr:uncharacterized protein FDP41_007089 [Naegleria fowleri]KAF0973702.1 hypothetical protein FDP41_007089 [Naegleria fowleri]